MDVKVNRDWYETVTHGLSVVKVEASEDIKPRDTLTIREFEDGIYTGRTATVEVLVVPKADYHGEVMLSVKLTGVYNKTKDGVWIMRTNENSLDTYECNICGGKTREEYQYCPHCGKKMGGVTVNDSI